MVTDLVDRHGLTADAPGVTGSVVVCDVLLYTVELVELAARFATDLACDDVSIDVDLANIQGRQLISGEWTRELYGPNLVSTDGPEARRRMTTTNLLADPRGVAVSIVQDLLGQFGLNEPDQVLMDWQEQTFRGR